MPAKASKINKIAGGYQSCLNAIDDSLKNFGFGKRVFTPRLYVAYNHHLAIDYLDLYLIHSAYGGKAARLEAWEALLAARKAGKVRSVGVSN